MGFFHPCHVHHTPNSLAAGTQLTKALCDTQSMVKQGPGFMQSLPQGALVQQ